MLQSKSFIAELILNIVSNTDFRWQILQSN